MELSNKTDEINFQDALNFVSTAVEKLDKFKNDDSFLSSMNFEAYQIILKQSNFHLPTEEMSILGDTLANSKTDVGCVIVSYMNALTRNGKHCILQGYNKKCMTALNQVCIKFTDGSDLFRLSLCNAGIIPLMAKLLIKFKDTFLQQESQNEAVVSAMGILYNCSRTTSANVYFHEANITETISWYAINIKSMSLILLLSCITLVYIIDEKQSDLILADDLILDTILHILDSALKASSHAYEGFSVEELETGISCLAQNQQISVKLVNRGILNMLYETLVSGNVSEKIAASRAVWILAFVDSNKKVILSNKMLINLIKTSLEAATGDEANLNLKRNLRGILWNLKQPLLNDEESVVFAVLHGASSGDEKVSSKHVMISYQWNVQPLMLKIKRKLESSGYNVWMDVDKMKDDMLEKMAEAVENAGVFLMAMSAKYKQSVACRTEAEYAYKLNIPIIPFKVDESYTPDGWLGAILGTKFYHNFTDSVSFQAAFNKLQSDIGDRGKIAHSSTHISNDHNVVESWTNYYVAAWLKEKTMLSFHNLDGKQLVFLSKVMKEAPEFYYRCVVDMLGLNSIEEIMNFTQALSLLFE